MGERPVQVTFSGENNFGTLGLSFYHEVSSCWNTAGAVSWERGTSKPKIEIGGECKCDGGSKVKAKVDSDAQVSCSMTQDIHSGVSATLSCSTDGKKFLSASPEAVKIGFALSSPTKFEGTLRSGTATFPPSPFLPSLPMT